MTKKTTSNVRILSRSGTRFADRAEAGRLLAYELKEYRRQRAVVLGIPRGGIIVAREIARELDADLDVVLAHKLQSPGYSELAMGSIAEDGRLFLNEDVVRDLNISQAYVEQERARQLEEIKRRIKMFRRGRARLPLTGRTVIVTDDGVATGATTQAALWALRLEKPGRLIAAFPVGPEDTIVRLAENVDEMICLRSPPMFMAVGQFYSSFEPVQDNEVVEILNSEIGRISRK
jgi:putative phosphoribosyl transferase